MAKVRWGKLRSQGQALHFQFTTNTPVTNAMGKPATIFAADSGCEGTRPPPGPLLLGRDPVMLTQRLPGTWETWD